MEGQHRIVVVGSSVIDFISYAARLPRPGETIRGTKFSQGYGGKGANQCIMAARLGATIAMVTKLGDDIYGNTYNDILKKENVETTYVQLTKEAFSGIAQIVVAENGENNIVIVPGANDLLSTSDVCRAEALIGSAKVVVCQFEVPLATTLEALKLCKKHGGTTIVNSAPALPDVDPVLFQLTDYFCANETEAEVVTGLKVTGPQDAEPAISNLLRKGCSYVIITLGNKGAVFASKEDPSIVHIPTCAVTTVDSTGAGDAFIGALAYFLAYHPQMTLSKIIKGACEIATVSVTRPGTHVSFPKRNELKSSLFEV